MKPILQAILVADHVYQDKFSGKVIVAGVFNALNLIKQPTNDHNTQQSPIDSEETVGPRKLQPHEVSRAGSPFCYINLTSVRGTLSLEIRFVDLADNAVLLRCNLPEITSDDPLKNHEIVLVLPPLTIPHAGCYALELLLDNELLGSHRITAKELPPPNEQGEEKI